MKVHPGGALRPAAAILAIAVLATVGGTQAARAGVVAVIKSAPLGSYDEVVQAFRGDYRGEVLEASLEREDPAALARRLERAPLDVVVAVGLRAALFSRDHFPRVPMVFCAVPNHGRHDLAGTWITGISADVPERSELRALKDAAPDVTRLGVLMGREGNAPFLRAAREAAAATGITLVERPISDLSSLPAEARDLAGMVDALWLPADPSVATPEAFQFLLELSLSVRKPLLVFSESLVRAGALVAVSPDFAWVGGRAADAVRRIQAGERAGDIPVTPLKRSRVVVNGATARAIGRDLPAAMRDVEVPR